MVIWFGCQSPSIAPFYGCTDFCNRKHLSLICYDFFLYPVVDFYSNWFLSWFFVRRKMLQTAQAFIDIRQNKCKDKLLDSRTSTSTIHKYTNTQRNNHFKWILCKCEYVCVLVEKICVQKHGNRDEGVSTTSILNVFLFFCFSSVLFELNWDYLLVSFEFLLTF